jgi:phosphoglucosamine mutase
MKKLFGTDGIRAQAGEFPLNATAVVAIGQAIGEKLGGRILVGQDTRLSSPWIFTLLAEGIRKTKATIEDAGVIPTPAIALLTKTHDFSGGIMISASHNAYDDNGIKVFSSDGRKLSDADETAIEARIADLFGGSCANTIDTIPLRQVDAANATRWPAEYERLLLAHFPQGEWLKGVRIVADCANGAMSQVAPALLEKLGAKLTLINASPTGTNINAACGAVHLDALMNAMKTHTADFGIAFDGDGDRSMFVSSSGRLMDGDAVLLLMARRLKHQGKLTPAVVVGTQMTNFSLEKMLASEGIALKRVAVGDRYIFEEMQKSGAVLGGEPSGHLIFSDFRLSGDGLLTLLKVAEATVGEHASFDELTHDWQPSPQLLKGVRVRQRVPIEQMPALQAKMKQVLSELESRGRLVIRYSGTEPLLRVMIESDDANRNERLMNETLETIRQELA